MSSLRAFLAFLYDFVVGDDPRLFLVVAVALAVVALVVDAGANLWWVLPVAVVAALTWSVRRVG